MGVQEQRGTTAIEGGRIAWRRVGDGPPLVLVNGYAATAQDWDPTFLEALAAGRTVVCPDNRGMGASTGDVADLTVDAMADDVAAVVGDLDLGPVDLAGWSMGGFIAQTLAARGTVEVRRLALLSTDPGGDVAVQRTAEVQRRLTDHDGTPDEQARRLLGLLFPEPLATDIYAQVGQVVADARAAIDVDVLSAQEAAMERWYAAPAAERLDALTRLEVLAACGDADVVIPPANVDRFAASLPGTWTARLTGGGHAFMAQEPVRLAALLGAFFAT